MSVESTIESIDEYIKTVNLLAFVKLTVAALAELPDGTLSPALEEVLDVANALLQNNKEPDHPE